MRTLSSASALSNSSLSSRTFRSCPARASRKPAASVGEGIIDAGALGVDGNEGKVVEVGVGLVDSLLVETGNCKDSRFGRVRGVKERGRALGVLGSGGGSIAVEVVFGEVVKCGLGGAAAGCVFAPAVNIDSIEARSRDDRRRIWPAMVIEHTES